MNTATEHGWKKNLNKSNLFETEYQKIIKIKYLIINDNKNA